MIHPSCVDVGSESYTAFAKGLHWFFAAAFLSQFIVDQLMHNLPDGNAKWWFYDLHKSIGITLLDAVFFRLLWRWIDPPPALPTSMPAWHFLADTPPSVSDG